MHHSKDIFEKVRLYKINHFRYIKGSIDNKKKINLTLPNQVIKKQSKIKLFFKFIIGYIASFFEYLTMKSNNKNLKTTVSTINQNSTLKNATFYDNKKIETVKINNNININNKIVTEKKVVEIKNNYIQKNEQSKQVLNQVKNNVENTKKDFVSPSKKELQDVKNNLILLEDKIIYADFQEELDTSKQKILNIKQNLQKKKNSNMAILDNLSNDENKVKNEMLTSNDQVDNTTLDIQKNPIKNTSNEFLATDNKSSSLEQELITKEELNEKNFENNFNVIDNDIKGFKQDINENNIEIDKLIERCDEDLCLIDERKTYIEIEKEYESTFKVEEQNQINFKLTKKDLRQIKNNVNSILARQQYNLEQLKKYSTMPTTSQLYIGKVNNFLKSTAKLTFSFIPFFAFPNKLIGLATSAILFNDSLKSYRRKPNMSYINQNLKMMISNSEACLKVGIQNSKDALNEINSIKMYLDNVPREVKDTLEYRKYLVDVNSVQKLVNKQIEIMQKMSKNYNDIKIKVKKIEY